MALSLSLCPSHGRVPDAALAACWWDGLDGGGEAEGVTRGGLSMGGGFHVAVDGCLTVVSGGSIVLCG